MLVWFGFFIGVFIGILLEILLQNIRTASGTLRIDRTDLEKDIYRLDIDNLDDLSKKDKITLKVDNNADLSR